MNIPELYRKLNNFYIDTKSERALTLLEAMELACQPLRYPPSIDFQVRWERSALRLLARKKQRRKPRR